jgi:hypothetical protein
MDWLYLKQALFIPYFKHLGSSLWVAIELIIQKGIGMDKPKGEYFVSCRYDWKCYLNNNKLVWV